MCSEDNQVGGVLLEEPQHRFHRILLLGDNLPDIDPQLRHSGPGAVLRKQSPPLECLSHARELHPILFLTARHVEHGERGFGDQRSLEGVGEGDVALRAKVCRMKHVLQNRCV